MSEKDKKIDRGSKKFTEEEIKKIKEIAQKIKKSEKQFLKEEDDSSEC